MQTSTQPLLHQVPAPPPRIHPMTHAKQLKGLEVCYCIAQPPKPYFDDIEEVVTRTRIAMFQVVNENAHNRPQQRRRCQEGTLYPVSPRKSRNYAEERPMWGNYRLRFGQITRRNWFSIAVKRRKALGKTFRPTESFRGGCAFNFASQLLESISSA